MARRSRLFVLLALAAVLMFVAACGGGGGSQPSTSGGAAPAPAGQAEEPAAKVAPAAIGEKVTAGTWDLVVKGVSSAPEAGGIKAAEGNEQFIVDLALTNNASTGQGTGPVYFKLRDAAATEYQATPTSGEEFIFNTPQPIGAGETRAVKIAYELPKGTTGLTLTFEPFVEGGVPEPPVVTLN